MKIIFGTTNKRKIEDLKNIIQQAKLELEVLTLDDIGYTEEIEENGQTLEENSLIKASAIYDFCKKKGINIPVLTDDAGLFVNSLNGEPGIFTARYADAERKQNPTLPKYECVNKLLRNLEGQEDRTAEYRCAVTYMYPNGKYFQKLAASKGRIIDNLEEEPVKKPYFYYVFALDGTDKPFIQLTEQELQQTYRYKALEATIGQVKETQKRADKDDFER